MSFLHKLEKYHIQKMDFKYCKERYENLAGLQRHVNKPASTNAKSHIRKPRNVRRSLTEKQCGNSRRCVEQRVLLQPLHQKETRWFKPIYCQSQSFESSNSSQAVQNAQPCISEKRIEGKSLDDQYRSQGCILPHISAQKSTEIPAFYGEQYNIPIPNIAIWTNDCSKSVYRARKHISGVGSRATNKHNQLLGRSVATPQVQDDIIKAQRISNAKGSIAGVDNKHNKIKACTTTHTNFHRHGIELRDLYGNTCVSKDNQTRRTITNVQKSVGLSTRHSTHARDISLIRRANRERQTETEEFPVCSQTPKVGHHEYKHKKVYPCNNGNEECTSMVGKQGKYYKRCEISSWSTGNYNHNRCFQAGLGRGVSGADHPRDLVTSRKMPAYKCVGNESSQDSTEQVSTLSKRQTCLNNIGQHEHTGIPEIPRRNPITHPNMRGRENSGLRNGKQYHNQYNTYFIGSECISRPTQSRQPSCPIRMDVVQTDIQINLCKTLSPTNRFICHEVEQPSEQFCEPMPRLDSQTHQCNDDGLEHVHKDLLISPSKANGGNSKEIRKLQGKGNPDSATQQNKVLSCRTVQDNDTETMENKRHRKPANPRNKNKNKSSATRTAEPSRVDKITDTMRKKGFSKTVSKLAAQCQRESTIDRYDFIWKQFTDWYSQRSNRSVYKASKYAVADYLVKLKNDGKAYATILTHKSAVCSTLHHTTKKNYSNDHTVQNLLKSFKNTITKKVNNVPEWNFHIVLAALRKAPFEPIRDSSLKYLTMKALFLTAWCSAARVSELHALSTKAGHFLMDTNNNYVDLIADTGFIAKNQRASEPPRKYRIKSIKNYTASDDPDILLCPVRALNIYKKRTEHLRTASERLFVCINKKKDMAIHSISYWLRQTIKISYELTKPQELRAIHKITPHEIRAISTSFALSRHVPIKDILKHGYWRAENTFTAYYLKDLAKYETQIQNIDTIAAGFCLQI